jgi:hypothetical protein
MAGSPIKRARREAAALEAALAGNAVVPSRAPAPGRKQRKAMVEDIVEFENDSIAVKARVRQVLSDNAAWGLGGWLAPSSQAHILQLAHRIGMVERPAGPKVKAEAEAVNVQKILNDIVKNRAT